MPTQTFEVETRIHSLQSVLTNADHKHIVDLALQDAKGDWSTALTTLKNQLPSAALKKVTFAHSLAEWSSDNMPVIKKLSSQLNITNLRDVALRYNTERLTSLLEPAAVPDTTPGATPAEKAKNFAVGLQRKLFAAEPSAVVQRMVKDAEIPIADAALRTNVAGFLNNQPDFNIRTTSVYTAFRQPDAFKGISNEQRSVVAEQLKTLQRVQALTPMPEAIPTLMKANLTSAFRVAEMPESTFMAAHGPSLGAATAKQIYTHAVNAHLCNEHALMTMRESVRGSGLAIIDGPQPMEMRMAEMQKVADKHEAQLNLEALFGNMDFCECGECTSVYSPAAYFVDLLQYLRNNNLDPKNPNTGKSGIAGTPLEKLFRRRPDLGCLELTCVNTNTILPYIDLVNEVMESFVVHLGQYHADTNDPKQATLDVFNVVDETSSELLAQPQHTNYEAYCTLKSAVYPFTLPYHQPIDAIRIFLDYLGTSRWELLDTYRAACCIEDSSAFTRDEQEELKKLCTVILDRAVDAEFLGLTQEEYIILTKEAFWPKRYFDLTQHKAYTDDDYRQNIGVKPVHVYYGYGSEPDMLNLDETKKIGLTFVKRQFLPRTGILYVDLIELLKNRFINPNFPQGKALTLLESIRFSYRFLQTLVDTSSANPAVRFAKLVEFLEKTQPLLPVLDAMLHPDPCHQHKPDHCSCLEGEDLRGWVHCYFERIGKLIVLESGEGPHLPIAGKIVTEDAPPVFVGNLRPDGMIVDEQGKMVGTVDILGRVLSTDGKLLVDKLGASELRIEDEEGKLIGSIHANGIQGPREERITWLPAQETCDLEKVRLTHLDGTSVTVSEYDRIHRFIRLWRKLGWTIDETDKALGGWSDGQHIAVAGAGTSETTDEHCEPVSFDIFTEACEIPADESDEDCEPCGGEWDCPDPAEALEDITPDFLHQLVAIKKLLDLTGLPLPKLLTFWADISTVGGKSLYASLFLTHNLLGIDKVFKADKNGNYLTQSAKISDHLPVLMAAFRLKADDITSIVAFRKLSDALTLSNASVLYRHSLLAKILHVKVSELAEVIALFGDPFISADQTVRLLETWGKMEDAGFTFWQLNYLIRDQDDPLRPLAPSEKTILQLSKTLYDGLNGIDRDHKDLGPNDEATSDLVRAKAGLLFEQSIVEQILGLLEGTTIYSTNAPAGLTINVPESLAKKLQYAQQKDAVPPAATLQTVGILTDGEKASALALSNHPKWPDAIGRVGKQAQNIFNDALLGVFPDVANAKTQLLKGDFANPDDAQDPANTAPQKRLYFMNGFLPFLRKQLAQRLITDTTSAAASLPPDATSELLKNIL